MDTSRTRSQSTSSSSTSNSTLKPSDDDLRYGCCYSHPGWLQPLNNIVGYVTFFSLAYCMESVANGLIGIVLSTIERQFDLSSSASSWIASSYEIGSIPVLIILSLIGSRIHKPRATAVGLLAICLGCVLFFIPQFTTPQYHPTDELRAKSLCTSNKTSICDKDDSRDSLSYYLPVFIISSLLMATGTAPILSIGVNYIDDCSTKEKFAKYAGVYNAMSVIGPAVGFVAGSMTLSLYTDFYIVSSDELPIDSSDPRWVGAWWLSYAFTALLCLLIAIPLLGYPHDLPGAAEIRAKKVTEAHNDQIVDDGVGAFQSQLTYAKTAAEYKTLAKGVFTNPVYWMLTLFWACNSFLIAGFNAFGPKYFQFGFSMSPTLAGIIFGVVLLPAGAGGTIIGGLLIEKLRLNIRQIFYIQIVMSGIITAGSALFLFICDSIQFAGVTVPYNVSSANDATMYLTNICNVNCSCNEVLYEPICSHDSLQYYSPCHAGCLTQHETEFYNCSCISSPNITVAPAMAGICSSGICTEAIVFLVGFFIAVVAIFICITTNVTATLRCVTSSETVFAFGIQVILVKLLGSIPGPLMMGIAFDNACMLWQTNCGTKGSCMFYDNADLSLQFVFLCLGVSGISLVSVVVGLICYRAPTVVQDRVVVVNTNTDGDDNAKPPASPVDGSAIDLTQSPAAESSELTRTNGFVNKAFNEPIDDLRTVYF